MKSSSTRFMCQLFESIKVVDGSLVNIEYHNARVNRSRRELLNCFDDIDLGRAIEIPLDHPGGIYKCRVAYDRGIERVEFIEYQRRTVNTLTLVECDSIEYSHKYADRSCLDALFKGVSTDDILIIKHGFVTDTSFANIAFSDGTRWITPSTPLLPGTARARLLDEGKIMAEEVRRHELRHFRRAVLINAMLDHGMEHFLRMEDIK